jgi:LPXTG-motif cell wall-anchored protein
LALAALPMLAHHPFDSQYDASKLLTLTGEIEDFNWDNPHCYITLDVESGPLQGEWKLEGASRTMLAQNGWEDDTIGKGDKITVHAYRAKDGSMTGSARTVTLEDGKTLIIADAKEDGGPDPAISTGQTGPSKEPEVSAARQEPKAEVPETPLAQAPREVEPLPRDPETPLAAQADRGPSDIESELPATSANIYSIALSGLMALSGAYYLRRRRRS